DSSNKLGWLLEDLSITGVRFAVLLSDDGLRITPQLTSIQALVRGRRPATLAGQGGQQPYAYS
ncbi:hypothetical protein ABZ420_02945, partial [Nocardia sp. NPDC005745]